LGEFDLNEPYPLVECRCEREAFGSNVGLSPPLFARDPANSKGVTTADVFLRRVELWGLYWLSGLFAVGGLSGWGRRVPAGSLGLSLALRILLEEEAIRRV